jgi:hypothetical protein
MLFKAVQLKKGFAKFKSNRKVTDVRCYRGTCVRYSFGRCRSCVEIRIRSPCRLRSGGSKLEHIDGDTMPTTCENPTAGLD